MATNGQSTSLTTVPLARGEVVRQGAEGMEVARTSEISGSALAAQAQATIQALFAMARFNPRNIDNARVKFLRDCERFGFAESARYKLPRRRFNKDTQEWETFNIEGWSIRAMETMARYLGNLDVGQQVIHEDADQIIAETWALDLETCFRVRRPVRVAKVIERGKPRKDQEVLGKRTDSKGQPVYLVRPTEDEIRTTLDAQCAKALRECIKRMVPGDILDDAERVCVETERKGIAALGPDVVRRRILDAFAKLNIMPSQLDEFLGCPSSQASPQQVETLRALYQTISAGEVTFSEALAEVVAARTPTEVDGKGSPAPQGAGGGKLAKALEARKRKASEGAGRAESAQDAKGQASQGETLPLASAAAQGSAQAVSGGASERPAQRRAQRGGQEAVIPPDADDDVDVLSIDEADAALAELVMGAGLEEEDAKALLVGYPDAVTRSTFKALCEKYPELRA